MPETNSVPVKAPIPEGSKGLVMLAPVIGLPVLLHAVTGAVVGGVGAAVMSMVLGPVAKQVLPEGFNLADLPSLFKPEVKPVAAVCMTTEPAVANKSDVNE
ncbi:MAG: hypothetical protein HGB02_07255 [Chlorobiaceae bacterium]|nr:hypothetical protein [Chlorobiaceae bacterium]